MMNLIEKKIINQKRWESLVNLPSKKESILHFLPIDLEYLTKEKKIIFNKKNIKTSYLIDIISNMILKYYFKKENLFALNAMILKSRYGFYYNYYIDYLVQEGYITKVMNHKSGITSRLYCLNERLLNNKIKRHKTIDGFLIKKYLSKFSFNDSDNQEIPLEIKKRLISDLFNVSIDKESSILYIKNIKASTDVYNRNIYSIEAIDNAHIFYNFDKYGRLHTNFTILKSGVRKAFIKINNEETSEIDIPNSQPLFLSKLIHETKTHWVEKNELDLFIYLTINSIFYQYIIDNSEIKNKKEVKDLTYTVLFGKNYPNSKYDKVFKKLFPTIHNFIKIYKKNHNDYKVLSHHLQKMESNFIFNIVVKKIYEYSDDISIITIHDSIVMRKKDKDLIEAIFENEKNVYFNFN